MGRALRSLNHRGEKTPCQDAPVLYADMRQNPEDARKLCEGCPVIELCAPLGFTESVYANDMVYGGLTWRRGLPVVSETAYREKRQRSELKRIQTRTHAADSPRIDLPVEVPPELILFPIEDDTPELAYA